ncbi:MAG: MBL fold metallo-hydrolase [Clostridiaceae bacterium]|nr:MBL fold metallo-hydrolase [Clostridiaceae bacterium]
MLIKTLMENTAQSPALGCEHGLSLYIEALGRQILFDTGASPLFIDNAHKMDIDLSQVEFVVISHGHYDHGGGLGAFFEINDRAEVFIHPQAFGGYYARKKGQVRFIGIDERLKESKQIVFTADRFTITRGIRVFSNVDPVEPFPSSNRDLLKKEKGGLVDDDFVHEQNLVIEEEAAMVLFTGCAHNGIVNIVRHFHTIKGRYPDVVIGGFHLAKSDEDRESDEEIDRIAAFLVSTGAKYYTCHCTGLVPYGILKGKMGDRIDYLAAGVTLEV